MLNFSSHGCVLGTMSAASGPNLLCCTIWAVSGLPIFYLRNFCSALWKNIGSWRMYHSSGFSCNLRMQNSSVKYAFFPPWMWDFLLAFCVFLLQINTAQNFTVWDEAMWECSSGNTFVTCVIINDAIVPQLKFSLKCILTHFGRYGFIERSVHPTLTALTVIAGWVLWEFMSNDIN